MKEGSTFFILDSRCVSHPAPSTQHPRCLGAKYISIRDCWHHVETPKQRDVI